MMPQLKPPVVQAEQLNEQLVNLPDLPSLPSREEMHLARRALSRLDMLRRDALRHYLPIPGPIEAFHRSVAATKLIGGSNRAGKTLAATADVAWYLRGCHPYDNRFPKHGLLCYAVGADEKHIQNLMWPKLSQAPFRIIRDEKTRQWRVWQPWQDYDKAYCEKARDAEPFIPENLIQGGLRGISWHSKKDNCPAMVRLTNGSRIQFFTAKGFPQKGTDIHLGWLDEECPREGWYPELRARCVSYGGIVIWSATPEVATPQFFDLYQAALRCERDGGNLIEQFWCYIWDNPYFTDQQRAEFKATLPERQVEVKYYGKFASTGRLVYPEFSPTLHSIQSHPIPPDWTRYMVTDPGRETCAVLFAAVPPDNQSVHIFNELYIKRSSARIYAGEVKRVLGGEWSTGFQAFIIDFQGARVTEMGSGRTIIDQFSEELAKLGITSNETGSDFYRGSRNVRSRTEALRGWLELQKLTQKPVLRIHKESCPNLMWEMERQFYKKNTDGTFDDKKRVDRDDHLATCLEYLADYQPRYVVPEKDDDNRTPFEELLRPKRRESDGVRLGPMY